MGSGNERCTQWAQESKIEKKMSWRPSRHKRALWRQLAPDGLCCWVVVRAADRTQPARGTAQKDPSNQPRTNHARPSLGYGSGEGPVAQFRQAWVLFDRKPAAVGRDLHDVPPEKNLGLNEWGTAWNAAARNRMLFNLITVHSVRGTCILKALAFH